METVMTFVAWSMMAAIAIGAMGGWLVFVIAWLENLHADGRFNRWTRGGAVPWRLIRRKRSGEQPHRSGTWNTSV